MTLRDRIKLLAIPLVLFLSLALLVGLSGRRDREVTRQMAEVYGASDADLWVQQTSLLPRWLATKIPWRWQRLFLRIESINLRYPPGSGLPIHGNFSGLSRLRWIDIKNPEIRMPKGGLNLSDCPSLQSANFVGNTGKIEAITNCPKLGSIYILDWDLQGKLPDLHGNPEPTHLKIETKHLIGPGPRLVLPALQRLEIQAEEVEEWPDFSGCPSVRFLALRCDPGGPPIPDIGTLFPSLFRATLKGMQGTHFPSIEHLELASLHLEDLDIEEVPKTYDDLEELRLIRMPIREVSSADLPPRLKTLELDSLPVLVIPELPSTVTSLELGHLEVTNLEPLRDRTFKVLGIDGLTTDDRALGSVRVRHELRVINHPLPFDFLEANLVPYEVSDTIFVLHLENCGLRQWPDLRHIKLWKLTLIDLEFEALPERLSMIHRFDKIHLERLPNLRVIPDLEGEYLTEVKIIACPIEEPFQIKGGMMERLYLEDLDRLKKWPTILPDVAIKYRAVNCPQLRPATK